MRGTHTAKGDGPFSRKALIALILPLIAEQFLEVLVGMADTAMVSGVDATGSAVAAVSTVDTLNVLFINLFHRQHREELMDYEAKVFLLTIGVSAVASPPYQSVPSET